MRLGSAAASLALISWETRTNVTCSARRGRFLVINLPEILGSLGPFIRSAIEGAQFSFLNSPNLSTPRYTGIRLSNHPLFSPSGRKLKLHKYLVATRLMIAKANRILTSSSCVWTWIAGESQRQPGKHDGRHEMLTRLDFDARRRRGGTGQITRGRVRRVAFAAIGIVDVSGRRGRGRGGDSSRSTQAQYGVVVVVRSLATVMLVVGVVLVVLRMLRVIALVRLVKLVCLVMVMHVVVGRVRGRVNQSFQSGQVRTGWVERCGRGRRGRPC